MKPALSVVPLLATLLVVAGCSTSSHVVVGNVRPPTKPENVKLFLQPPKKYEQVGLVNADNIGSTAVSNQRKINVAVARLKKEAAKLGANGILLGNVSGSGGVVVSSTSGYQVGSTFNSTGVGVVSGGHIKNVSGIAIYVTEE